MDTYENIKVSSLFRFIITYEQTLYNISFNTCMIPLFRQIYVNLINTQKKTTNFKIIDSKYFVSVSLKYEKIS